MEQSEIAHIEDLGTWVQIFSRRQPIAAWALQTCL